MRATAALALAGLFLASGCGSKDTVPADPLPNPLVGRWQLVRTCEDTLTALEYFGLEKIARFVLVDFFPDRGADDLPRRLSRICRGAVPLPSSHYFTAEGQFGSLDADGAQTDLARYTIVDARTFRLHHQYGAETFRFRIEGDALTLEPLISPGAIRDALDQRGGFGMAAHMIVVAMPGQPWHRTACETWC